MEKTAEELYKEHTDKRLREFKQGLEAYYKRGKLLQRVHDIRDVIMWLVILPVVPIIVIIQAIRGEL
jgi:hypothetical protein